MASSGAAHCDRDIRSRCTIGRLFKPPLHPSLPFISPLLLLIVPLLHHFPSRSSRARDRAWSPPLRLVGEHTSRLTGTNHSRDLVARPPRRRRIPASRHSPPPPPERQRRPESTDTTHASTVKNVADHVVDKGVGGEALEDFEDFAEPGMEEHEFDEEYLGDDHAN